TPRAASERRATRCPRWSDPGDTGDLHRKPNQCDLSRVIMVEQSVTGVRWTRQKSVECAHHEHGVRTTCRCTPRERTGGYRTLEVILMAERTLRGARLGGQSFEDERGIEFAARQQCGYRCVNGHEFEVTMSVEAEVPAVWECPRCGA